MILLQFFPLIIIVNSFLVQKSDRHCIMLQCLYLNHKLKFQTLPRHCNRQIWCIFYSDNFILFPIDIMQHWIFLQQIIFCNNLPAMKNNSIQKIHYPPWILKVLNWCGVLFPHAHSLLGMKKLYKVMCTIQERTFCTIISIYIYFVFFKY